MWCEPCKVELRALQSLYDRYREKGFSIIAINQDSPRSLAKVRSYTASQRFTFPIVPDPNTQLFERFNGQAIPLTLLFDRDGTLALRRVGYLPGDETSLESEIRSILRESE